MTDSYFTDDSLLRRVHREKVVALSGPSIVRFSPNRPGAVATPSAAQ